MQNLSHKSSWTRIFAVGVIACTLAACGGSDKKSTPSSATASSTPSVAASSTPPSSTPLSSTPGSSSIPASSSTSSAPALVGNLMRGKTLFESTCVACHGTAGVGGTAPAINTGKTTFVKNSVNYTLVNFIDEFMPKSNPSACVGQCAADVAAYITNGFADTYPIVAKVGYTLQLIDHCGDMETPSANSYVILDNDTNRVTGWNHAAPGFIAPYDKLGLTTSSDRLLYNVPGVTAADSTCNMLKTQSVVLIKKYANWDKQHSNGIEPSIAAANKTFADADKIVIEMKLNSAKTRILDKAALKAIYTTTLTDTEYDYLDQAKAAFGISFVGPSSVKVEFQRFIELDPAIYNDKWVRVTIPIADMDKFTGDPWVRTPTTVLAQAATVADRIRINPELYGSRVGDAFKWGNVIRNFIVKNSDAEYAALNLPENFKELHITVKKIEVVWK